MFNEVMLVRFSLQLYPSPINVSNHFVDTFRWIILSLLLLFGRIFKVSPAQYLLTQVFSFSTKEPAS